MDFQKRHKRVPLCANSIMGSSLRKLIIPCFLDCHERFSLNTLEGAVYLTAYPLIKDTDFFHQMPGAGVLDQELSLLALLVMSKMPSIRLRVRASFSVASFSPAVL